MEALRQGVLDLEAPAPGARAALMEGERYAAERAAAGQRWRKVVGRDGREMHENSLAARAQQGDVLTGRMLLIYDWLRGHGPATDREVKEALFGQNADMNMVRPRISDLVRVGALRQCGKRRDPVTGVPVRVVGVVGRGESDR